MRAAAALLAFELLGSPVPSRAAEAPAPLVLERTIPLPRVSGRIDHMAIDLRRGRLFIAELGNGSLEAVDLPSGTSVRRITGLNEPQGVAYAPGADVVAIASGGDGSVRLFRGETLDDAGALALGEDADNMRLEPGSGRLVVGYSRGGLAVIDPANRSVVIKAKLPAHKASSSTRTRGVPTSMFPMPARWRWSTWPRQSSRGVGPAGRLARELSDGDRRVGRGARDRIP